MIELQEAVCSGDGVANLPLGGVLAVCHIPNRAFSSCQLD